MQQLRADPGRLHGLWGPQISLPEDVAKPVAVCLPSRHLPGTLGCQRQGLQGAHLRVQHTLGTESGHFICLASPCSPCPDRLGF